MQKSCIPLLKATVPCGRIYGDSLEWKLHKNHRHRGSIVRDAIFFAGLKTVERCRAAHSVSKVFYADNWEDATDFVRDTDIDIDPVYEKWLRACDFYLMWRGQTIKGRDRRAEKCLLKST